MVSLTFCFSKHSKQFSKPPNVLTKCQRPVMTLITTQVTRASRMLWTLRGKEFCTCEYQYSSIISIYWNHVSVWTGFKGTQTSFKVPVEHNLSVSCNTVCYITIICYKHNYGYNWNLESWLKSWSLSLDHKTAAPKIFWCIVETWIFYGLHELQFSESTCK